MRPYNYTSYTPKKSYQKPELEIIISKQDTVFTDENGGRSIITRIQTNNRSYWMFKDKIVDDNVLEELYTIVNRDSKIDTILTNE